MLDWFVVIAVI